MDVYCLGKILERTGVGANFTESIIQHAQVGNPLINSFMQRSNSLVIGKGTGCRREAERTLESTKKCTDKHL